MKVIDKVIRTFLKNKKIKMKIIFIHSLNKLKNNKACKEKRVKILKITMNNRTNRDYRGQILVIVDEIYLAIGINKLLNYKLLENNKYKIYK